MEKSKSHLALEEFLHGRDKLKKKRAGYVALGPELQAQVEQLKVSGGVDDPRQVTVLATVLAKIQLLPGAISGCDDQLFAMESQLREGVQVPANELRLRGESFFRPHREQLLAECLRAIAPLVRDRERRAFLADQISNASEKGVAILRLEHALENFGMGNPDEVASSILSLHEDLEKFEQQYPENKK